MFESDEWGFNAHRHVHAEYSIWFSWILSQRLYSCKRLLKEKDSMHDFPQSPKRLRPKALHCLACQILRTGNISCNSSPHSSLGNRDTAQLALSIHVPLLRRPSPRPREPNRQDDTVTVHPIAGSERLLSH